MFSIILNLMVHFLNFSEIHEFFLLILLIFFEFVVRFLIRSNKIYISWKFWRCFQNCLQNISYLFDLQFFNENRPVLIDQLKFE